MPVSEKKTKLLVTVDKDDLAAVSDLCAEYRNLNPNQIAAMAIGELAKLRGKKGELFHALARISDTDSDAAIEPQKRKRPSASSRASSPALSGAH